MLRALPFLRRLGVISLLLAVGACAQLNWQQPDRDTSSAATRTPDRPAGSGSSQSAGNPDPEFSTGNEKLVTQREQLRRGDRALAPEQVGYFMDVLEARLRQAIDATDIGMGRGKERFFVTVPGASSFDTGSSQLMRGIQPALARLAEVLAEFDNTLVVINGHTDNQGDADLNRTLSEQRALAVAEFLAASDVAAERIVVIGQGETQPAANNDTPEGRAANRRVEIVVEPLVQEPAG